ncbi:MAG: energy-coupling factor ABC transporter substrate-binding protein [Anaerolineae bacterium]|nr:energy-coupling factor ABC transporter substrate-binding protein [Anaerolineae bacterium]
MSTQVQRQPTKRYSVWVIIPGIVAIILLMVIPLLINKDSEFGGSDGAGSEAITTIAPDYNSEWTTNWWKPPGGETESALFALQATVGGILIGYFFGYLHGRKRGRQDGAANNT